MLIKKGIVRKTFLFSTLLIVLVTLISFAFMYFIMPGHYLGQKQKSLFINLDALAGKLQAASTYEECAGLIAAFSDVNNVNIFSLDKDGSIIPMLSTPFINMEGNGDTFYLANEFPDKKGNGMVRVQIRTERVLIDGQESDLEENNKQGKVMVKWRGDTGINVISMQGTVGSYMIDTIVANGTLQPIDEAKGVILSLIPYVLAIAIIVGLILSGIYARQLSKPILRISDAALRMQRMEPDAVSGIKTTDELGRLSANLDALYSSLLENIEHLKTEMDKVNRMERAKTEMMQSASHELKTPIAALNGMIEGMMDNIGVYRDKEKYLAECKEQVDKLSTLVGEILGASQADVTDAGLELSDTHVNELLERAIAENMYYIHEKKLTLTRKFSPAVIMSDPDTLYRAISNLISNAVRYTPENGEIRVTIAGEGTQRRLLIENECEPIPQDELTKLFEPFYTRSYSRDKTKSGTGLGLYIVRTSLEKLGVPYEAENTDLGFRVSMTI